MRLLLIATALVALPLFLLGLVLLAPEEIGLDRISRTDERRSTGSAPQAHPAVDVEGRITVDDRPFRGRVLFFRRELKGLHETRPDERGRFRIRGLAPGRWEVELQEWESPSSAFRHWASVELPTGEPFVLDLPISTLRGRLPMSGRQLVALHLGDAYLHQRTDEDGAFEMRLGLAGPAHLHLEAPPSRPTVARFELVPGTVTDLGIIQVPASDPP